MKACVIPIGLLAAILGFSLWAGRYVEVRTDHWIALLETADAVSYTHLTLPTICSV